MFEKCKNLKKANVLFAKCLRTFLYIKYSRTQNNIFRRVQFTGLALLAVVVSLAAIFVQKNKKQRLKNKNVYFLLVFFFKKNKNSFELHVHYT